VFSKLLFARVTGYGWPFGDICTTAATSIRAENPKMLRTLLSSQDPYLVETAIGDGPLSGSK